MVAAPSYLRSPVALSTNTEKRIVAIGDSLVYGYGDPEGGGWVERLRRQWLQPQSPGHAIYNLGVRADTTQRVAHRLVQEFQTRGEFRNRVPDLLLLSVGLNDSCRVGKANGRSFTEFVAFQSQMTSLLDAAVGLCPVMFIGMTPVLTERMPFAEVLYYSYRDQLPYRDFTRQACEQRQIPYLDVLDLWLSRGEGWWRSRLSTDGLHPNILGYRSLFDDVNTWDAFRKVIYL
ncbi:MAG: GDSL-type esterase/lipase family protein [Leptolyngbyaceae cyanobacterium]